ncbi:hypothetical protein RQP46_005184 [Phenoliferia psychrophenolica]
MLETVKSRRIYGFLILTVLPASFAVGFFLKEKKDEGVEKAATSPTLATTPLPVATVEDRIRMLRRQQAELERERGEVVEKLRRVQKREDGDA